MPPNRRVARRRRPRCRRRPRAPTAPRPGRAACAGSSAATRAATGTRPRDAAEPRARRRSAVPACRRRAGSPSRRRRGSRDRTLARVSRTRGTTCTRPSRPRRRRARAPGRAEANAGRPSVEEGPARACCVATANGDATMGATNPRASTAANPAAGAAIHANGRPGQPERIGRSSSTNDATASASVAPSWNTVSGHPETPTRSLVASSSTGQCQRYTP